MKYTVAHFPKLADLSPRQQYAAAAVILIAFTGSILLWKLGSARTFTGHECYVAQGAREMLATGDWLVPRVAGRPWLEKPPLAHWAVAASGWIGGGVTEFTARLPSALCGLLGVVLLARLAARRLGLVMGLLTGFVQAASVYFLTYARLAEADIYLWLLVVGCLTTFAQRWTDAGEPQRWSSGRLVFFLLLGLTQLVKGPLFGAVLVLLPCSAFLLSQPRKSDARWLCSMPGWLLFIGLAAAWPTAIIASGHQEAIDLWWLHTFGRLGGETALNPKPVWYYFTTLPWQVLPWTLVMLPAMPDSLRRAWLEPRSLDRLLWLWFALPLAALSLASAKHHHYLIYALPPCSFWAAMGLVRWRDLAAQCWRRPASRFALLGTMIAGLAVGLLLTKPDKVPPMELLLAGGGSIAVTAWIAWSCARQQYRAATGGLFVLLWSLSAYAHGVLMQRTDHYREDTLLLERLNDRAAGRSPVLIYGLEPSRLLLHLDVHCTVCQSAEELESQRGEGSSLVLTCCALEDDLKGLGRTTCLDRTPQPRNSEPCSWLAVYQLESLSLGTASPAVADKPCRKRSGVAQLPRSGTLR